MASVPAFATMIATSVNIGEYTHMSITQICLLGLFFFTWALYALNFKDVLDSYVQFRKRKPVNRLLLYSEASGMILVLFISSIPWAIIIRPANMNSTEVGIFWWSHALTAWSFIRSVKVYIAFRCSRPTTRLLFLLELCGLIVFFSTFFITWGAKYANNLDLWARVA
jgi:hypothetical protein